MTGTLLAHDSNMASFKSLMRLLSYASEREATVTYSKKFEMWPDCSFGKELGMSCSDEQRRRLEQAEKLGVLPKRY